MCHTRTVLAAGAAGRQFFGVVLFCVLAVLKATFMRGQKTDQMLPGTRACAHFFWFATKYGVRKVGHLTGIFFVVHLTGSVLFVYVTLL